MDEGPAQDDRQFVGEGRLEIGDSRLRYADHRRGERLVGAPFRRQRQPRWRRGKEEARVLIAGVGQRVEAARDKGVVERADRKQAFAEQFARKAERGEHEEQVVLGDAELDVLAERRRRPFLRRDHLFLPEGVGFRAAVEYLPSVDPGPQPRGDGHVGGGGDDAARQLAVAAGDPVEQPAERFLGGGLRPRGKVETSGHGNGRRREAPGAVGGEGRPGDERPQVFRIGAAGAETVPLPAVGDAAFRLVERHLSGRHETGVIVLVAGEGQAVALDRIGDDGDGAVAGGGFVVCLDDAFEVVAGEVRHQPAERRVVMRIEQRGDPRHAREVAPQAPPPGRAALEGQRRVELVRAAVDPVE